MITFIKIKLLSKYAPSRLMIYNVKETFYT